MAVNLEFGSEEVEEIDKMSVSLEFGSEETEEINKMLFNSEFGSEEIDKKPVEIWPEMWSNEMNPHCRAVRMAIDLLKIKNETIREACTRGDKTPEFYQEVANAVSDFYNYPVNPKEIVPIVERGCTLLCYSRAIMIHLCSLSEEPIAKELYPEDHEIRRKVGEFLSFDCFSINATWKQYAIPIIERGAVADPDAVKNYTDSLKLLDTHLQGQYIAGRPYVARNYVVSDQMTLVDLSLGAIISTTEALDPDLITFYMFPRVFNWLDRLKSHKVFKDWNAGGVQRLKQYLETRKSSEQPNEDKMSVNLEFGSEEIEEINKMLHNMESGSEDIEGLGKKSVEIWPEMWSNDMNPHCRAVRMTIDLLKIKNETIIEACTRGDKTPEFYQEVADAVSGFYRNPFNPKKIVTIVECKDTLLFHSRAIMIHLCSLSKEPIAKELYPEDPEIRKRVSELLSVDCFSINSSWKEYAAPIIERGAVADPDALKNYTDNLKLLDKHMRGEYIAGRYYSGQKYVASDKMNVASDNMTLVDLSLGAIISTTQALDPDLITFWKFPNIDNWLDRLKSHKVFEVWNAGGIQRLKQYLETRKSSEQ